jgi:hypothetical protein
MSPVSNLSPELHQIVAEKIRKLDGKLYVRYDSDASVRQRHMFGYKASRTIGFIECSEDGLNSNHEFCAQKNVNMYPTWEIKNRMYEGEKDIYQLEAIICNIERESSNMCLRNGGSNQRFFKDNVIEGGLENGP